MDAVEDARLNNSIANVQSTLLCSHDLAFIDLEPSSFRAPHNLWGTAANRPRRLQGSYGSTTELNDPSRSMEPSRSQDIRAGTSHDGAARRRAQPSNLR